MKDTIQIVQDSLYGFFTQIGAFLPKFIGALLILLIGWFIARSVRWAVTQFLRLVNLDGICERVGINDLLKGAGLKKNASHLIATLFYWIIMLAIWLSFFNALGLEAISGLLNRVILFMPNIIVSCLIMIVGFYLADFVRGVVSTTFKAGKVGDQPLFGKIAHAGVLFLAGSMALSQLGVAQTIIENTVQIVLGAVGFALALAFGLGGRDWAADIIKKIRE